MFKTTAFASAGVVILLALITTTGCSHGPIGVAPGATGPTFGILGYPIPMSPLLPKTL